MKRIRPHTIPERAHPHVRTLFAEMNRLDMSGLALAKRAGISRETLMNWRKGTHPKMRDIEACLNVCGLSLLAVPTEEATYSAAELARLRDKLYAKNDQLRAALLAFANHFGPLEDSSFLNEGARRCFALARAALKENDDG